MRLLSIEMPALKMCVPHTGEMVDPVQGGVVVVKRRVVGSKLLLIADACAGIGEARNIIVLHRAGVQQGNVDSGFGAGQPVADRVDVDLVVGDAEIELVGHGGAQRGYRVDRKVIAGPDVGDRG